MAGSGSGSDSSSVRNRNRVTVTPGTGPGVCPASTPATSHALTHYQALDNELSSETIIPNLDEDLESMADSFADSDLRPDGHAIHDEKQIIFLLQFSSLEPWTRRTTRKQVRLRKADQIRSGAGLLRSTSQQGKMVDTTERFPSPGPLHLTGN